MSEVTLPVPLRAASGATARAADPRARSFFRRATVQTRLTLAFCGLGGMSLIGTLLAIFQLHAMQRDTLADLRAVRAAGELHAAVAANAVRASVLARGGDAALIDLLPAFQATDRTLDELHGTLGGLSRSGEDGRLVEQAARQRDAFRQAATAALRSAPPVGQPPGAAPRALEDAAADYVKAVDAVARSHGAGGGASALEGRAARASRDLLLLFGVLTVLTTPIVVALFVHILRPMYTAVSIARKVADGDLTVKVRTGGRDEMARLMFALDDMTENLRRTVGGVVRGAGAVAEAGAQVRRGQQDLSRRTEMQASTLEETASSMEQLTATVTQNAQTARAASELAASAAGLAHKGGEVVGQVVGSMQGISESARRIEDITAVIDGIAFQTNILALNAAVEAARAGEQGRGFAVVAAEVRTLAQRCTAAAKEIKGLIGESVGKVEDGARLADSAGQTMQEIVGSVRRVSDMIAEIAAASDQQRAGIEQVNAAVGEMEGVVQQNAALVDETTRSTEALHAQAEALLASVSQFRLERSPKAAASRPEGPRLGVLAAG